MTPFVTLSSLFSPLPENKPIQCVDDKNQLVSAARLNGHTVPMMFSPVKVESGVSRVGGR